MSDNIPFEIQEQIMKKLPVKSLLQSRSVSKQWKSLIDSSNFIKTYANPQHHLLVEYESDIDEVKYISIIDDNTFPNHKFSLTFPQQQHFSDHFIDGYDQCIAGSSQGIICIRCSDRCDFDKEDIALLWNPTLKKTVSIVTPRLPADFVSGSSMLSFGVCPNTNDPKLVELIVYNEPTIKWEAKLFTLSTKLWKPLTIISTVFNNNNDLCGDVCIRGFMYFLARDIGIGTKLIVSFDLLSEEFGQVHLPDSLLHSRSLMLSKRNECLTLLETYNEEDVHVWMMNDIAFTKVFTLKSLGHLGCLAVLGFRENGKAIIRKPNYVGDEDSGVSLVEVYDQRVYRSAGVSSYIETLLLLDEADSATY